MAIERKSLKKRCGVSPCRDFLAHENDLVKCIKKQKRKKKSILKMFKNNWLFQGVHWNLFDLTPLRRYIKVDALDFFMYFFFIIYLNEVHLMYKEVIWIILNYSKNVGEYMYLPLKVILGFRHENPFLQNSVDNKLNIRPAYIMFKYSEKAANLQNITHFKFDRLEFPHLKLDQLRLWSSGVCDFMKYLWSSQNKLTLLMLFSTISIK